MAVGRSTAGRRSSSRTRTGVTCCCFTSISTAITALVSVPAIRRAGQRWWPSCYSKAVNSQRRDILMTQHYDVIIIGTGAGGGTPAYRLAPSGKHILLLERGDFLAREKQNWDVEEVFIKNRYVSPD